MNYLYPKGIVLRNNIFHVSFCLMITTIAVIYSTMQLEKLWETVQRESITKQAAKKMLFVLSKLLSAKREVAAADHKMTRGGIKAKKWVNDNTTHAYK